MKHENEHVYDDEMAPIITQLIEIAQRAGIPLFVSAGMIGEEGNELGCVTVIPREDPDGVLSGMDNRHGLCAGIVQGHAGFDTASGMVITRHHGGAS